MRHTLITEGYGVRLRPVEMEDAAFIVWLRNLDYVKGRVGDSAAEIAGQEKWLKSYFEKEDDYYFIVETLNRIPLGTYGFYYVTETTVDVGRFIIRPGVLAAVPATLLLDDLLYEQMGVTYVRVTTSASNHRLHSFYRKLGFRQVKVEQAGRIIGGQAIDMLHFIQIAEDRYRAREKVIPAARRAETWIREWEQAYLQNQGSQGLVKDR